MPRLVETETRIEERGDRSEAPEWTPSSYQLAILNWIREARPARRDAIVSAVAGSGKTAALELASGVIGESAPGARTIFLAFNRHIKDALRKRLGRERAVKTIHGLGFGIVRRRVTVPDKGGVQRGKCYRLAQQTLPQFGVSRAAFADIGHDYRTLLELVRVKLPTPTEWRDLDRVAKVAADHRITLTSRTFDACLDAVVPILEEGRRAYVLRANPVMVDYVDMIWLPHQVPGIIPAQFDWMLVDEAQDLNAAMRLLVLESRRKGGRIIFVGDPHQAINGFAGADTHSIAQIREACGPENVVDLPLSVCYRCPPCHLDLARRLVPEIEANPGHEGGMVEVSPTGSAVATVQPGDLVLARRASALTALIDELAVTHPALPVIFVGNDRAGKLKAATSRILMFAGGRMARVPDAIDVYETSRTTDLTRRVDEGEEDDDLDVLIAELKWVVRTLRVIYAEDPLRTRTQFEQRVAEWIPDPEDSVRCSTIHRAKGLEAKRVLLIDTESLPSSRAELPWEIQQEWNLLYVALTRSTRELVICGSLEKTPVGVVEPASDRRSASAQSLPTALVQTRIVESGQRDIAIGSVQLSSMDYDGMRDGAVAEADWSIIEADERPTLGSVLRWIGSTLGVLGIVTVASVTCYVALSLLMRASDRADPTIVDLPTESPVAPVSVRHRAPIIQRAKSPPSPPVDSVRSVTSAPKTVGQSVEPQSRAAKRVEAALARARYLIAHGEYANAEHAVEVADGALALAPEDSSAQAHAAERDSVFDAARRGCVAMQRSVSVPGRPRPAC